MPAQCSRHCQIKIINQINSILALGRLRFLSILNIGAEELFTMLKASPRMGGGGVNHDPARDQTYEIRGSISIRVRGLIVQIG